VVGCHGLGFATGTGGWAVGLAPVRDGSCNPACGSRQRGCNSATRSATSTPRNGTPAKHRSKGRCCVHANIRVAGSCAAACSCACACACCRYRYRESHPVGGCRQHGRPCASQSGSASGRSDGFCNIPNSCNASKADSVCDPDPACHSGSSRARWKASSSFDPYPFSVGWRADAERVA
jgi:hypothetical protein